MSDGPELKTLWQADSLEEMQRQARRFAEQASTMPSEALNAALHGAIGPAAGAVLMARAGDMAMNEVGDAILSTGLNLIFNLWGSYLLTFEIERGDAELQRLFAVMTRLLPRSAETIGGAAAASFPRHLAHARANP